MTRHRPLAGIVGAAADIAYRKMESKEQMADYTVSGYEGDKYISLQKPNSWRWQNETAIHLPDGRVFASYAEALAANGPQWIEIRVPVADVQQSDRDFIRGLYLTYLRREPDVSGWDFWTNELTTGRNTRAGIERAFAAEVVHPIGGDDDGTGLVGIWDGETGDEGDGGLIGGIQNTIGGVFDQIAESTGLSKTMLEVGAVGLVVAGLYFANSGSKTRR